MKATEQHTEEVVMPADYATFNKENYAWFTGDGKRVYPSKVVFQVDRQGYGIFFQILGCTGVGEYKDHARVNGKEKYKRILIQKIYPHVEEGE